MGARWEKQAADFVEERWEDIETVASLLESYDSINADMLTSRLSTGCSGLEASDADFPQKPPQRSTRLRHAVAAASPPRLIDVTDDPHTPDAVVVFINKPSAAEIDGAQTDAAKARKH